LALGLAVLCLAGMVPLSAQTLESLAREYRERPTPAHHSSLLRYAVARPNDPNGALALLALGVTEVSLGADKHADAIQHLKAARGRLPKLADYTGYELALADSGLKQFGGVTGDVFPVFHNSPPSPFLSRAVLLAADADVATEKSGAAVELLRQYYDRLPQPDGNLSLAAAYEAAHDLASAAVYYQRAYFKYPMVPRSDSAAPAMARLREALGGSYPPPTADAMLERADRLLAANVSARARSEYQTLAAQLAGEGRDLARVGIGAADYAAGETAQADRYLSGLQVSAPEADAERLYYLTECARRVENRAGMSASIERLNTLHASSRWRLKALVAAGNYYVKTNEWTLYVPLFRAAYEGFPTDPEADPCHWKVTWSAYVNRRPEAAGLLREHLIRFPSSSYAAAALYFLGRASEAKGDPGAAKACYQKLVQNFNGYYYYSLGEDRLRDRALADVFPSSEMRSFLSGLALRLPSNPGTFEPKPATRLRLERARLLALAALDDLAEEELRFGAATEDQPHVLAMEMARTASKHGAPDRAIRLIKKNVPDYFALPFDSAPRAFWELAYPLPYRSSLLRYANQRNLDPYLVAGLVRQESEFNPKAVSPARAYGLAQILPSTGRSISRKLGVKRFRTSTLLEPDTNLKFGVYYLRTLLDGQGGKLPQTLASYNAGSTRVASWMAWAEFREPAEFVETIPFSETRNYVQLVLRNAAFYRRLYGPAPPGAAAEKSVAKKSTSAPASKKALKSAAAQ
jgi:soluble lytic murein transglycosylase